MVKSKTRQSPGRGSQRHPESPRQGRVLEWLNKDKSRSSRFRDETFRDNGVPEKIQCGKGWVPDKTKSETRQSPEKD